MPSEEAMRLTQAIKPVLDKLQEWHELLGFRCGKWDSELLLTNGLSAGLDSWLTVCEGFAVEFRDKPVLLFNSMLVLHAWREPSLARFLRPWQKLFYHSFLGGLGGDETTDPWAEVGPTLSSAAQRLLDSIARLRSFCELTCPAAGCPAAVAIAIGQEFQFLWNSPLLFGLQYGALMTDSARRARREKTEPWENLARELYAELLKQKRFVRAKEETLCEEVAKQIKKRTGRRISARTVRRYLAGHTG